MTEGQQRLLGIGGIGLIAVYIVRRRSSVAVVHSPVSPSGSVAPFVPQSPLPLPPGESVYDPNSQALLTTPTGFPPAPQGNAPGAPQYTVNVNYPKHPAAKKPARKKPSKRKPAPKKRLSRAHAKHAKVGS